MSRPRTCINRFFPGTMRLGFCTIEACFLQHNGFDLSDEADQMGLWPTFSRMSYGSGREDERGEVTLVWRSLSQNTSETKLDLLQCARFSTCKLRHLFGYVMAIVVLESIIQQTKHSTVRYGKCCGRVIRTGSTYSDRWQSYELGRYY